MAPIRSLDDFLRHTPHEQRAYLDAIDGLYEMRRYGYDDREAEAHLGIPPGTIRRNASSALRKLPNGRVIATPTDDFIRPMRLVSTRGVVEVGLTQTQASVIGGHMTAIKTYRRWGDTERLDEYRGRRVAGHELETDLDVLDELLRRGELDWLDLYLRP